MMDDKGGAYKHQIRRTKSTVVTETRTGEDGRRRIKKDGKKRRQARRAKKEGRREEKKRPQPPPQSAPLRRGGVPGSSAVPVDAINALAREYAERRVRSALPPVNPLFVNLDMSKLPATQSGTWVPRKAAEAPAAAPAVPQIAAPPAPLAIGAPPPPTGPRVSEVTSTRASERVPPRSSAAATSVRSGVSRWDEGSLRGRRAMRDRREITSTSGATEDEPLPPPAPFSVAASEAATPAAAAAAAVPDQIVAAPILQQADGEAVATAEGMVLPGVAAAPPLVPSSPRVGPWRAAPGSSPLASATAAAVRSPTAAAERARPGPPSVAPPSAAARPERHARIVEPGPPREPLDERTAEEFTRLLAAIGSAQIRVDSNFGGNPGTLSNAKKAGREAKAEFEKLYDEHKDKVLPREIVEEHRNRRPEFTAHRRARPTDAELASRAASMAAAVIGPGRRETEPPQRERTRSEPKGKSRRRHNKGSEEEGTGPVPSELFKENSNYPPSVRSLMEKYGDYVVIKARACRTPLNAAIRLAGELITRGRMGRVAKELNYDKLFHLWAVFAARHPETRDVVVFMTEKNQTIVAKVLGDERGADVSVPKNTECKVANVTGDVTIKELFEKTRERVGDNRFFVYALERANCQVYIADLLGTLGGVGDLKSFVLQDARKLLGSPWIAKLANAIVSVAARAERAATGAGKCKGKGKKGGVDERLVDALLSTVV